MQMPEIGEQEQKDTSLVKKITDQCLVWHQEFNSAYWQKKPSFHDQDHVLATIKAGTRLWQAACQEDRDPLEIKRNLELWNQSHPRNAVDEAELGKGMEIAFACHDLGNIAAKAKKENGGVKIIFHDAYRAKGAEERSQKIAKTIIKVSDLDEELKGRLLPLVVHLIGEAVYTGGQDKPFGVMVRVVDQIGNDLFNANQEKAKGLLEEMRAEDAGATFNPDFFFNFARQRFPQLVASQATRQAILEIWEKSLAGEVTGLPNEQVSVRDFLQQHQGTLPFLSRE